MSNQESNHVNHAPRSIMSQSHQSRFAVKLLLKRNHAHRTLNHPRINHVCPPL